MQLKYQGPKPIISEHGVSFKDGKEDKYVYIQTAIEILNAIDHEYVQGKVYKYDAKILKPSDEEIEKIIIGYKPELKQTIDEEITSYKQYLKEEIENTSNSHPLLNKDELSALQNNLKIMHEYRIQRAINKIYYMHIIEIISDLIKEHEIKDISTPFNEKFWHVLETIQGALAKVKNYRASKIKENPDSTIELKIIS
ncbi:conserved hypothetical protein [Arcobacter nitrofigilis DSM 7299]|uniref:Uncharacterized protein n=1 Tax=Arcobacter nitrofigilis (strain ATCC 33309 / DSM 7299 / CCUG 15893 / LMG 7604 / NCTC 12251 / CI) TaxID=572480 RepID=D5V0L1_ARCNC|nr:hypothetical protein [Arcobacter nitrofigilis]ADG93823.1 conserved hypothetical protein [Arcobacter nitrofigilis DSM 7299]